jgi:hypothetical protein
LLSKQTEEVLRALVLDEIHEVPQLIALDNGGSGGEDGGNSKRRGDRLRDIATEMLSQIPQKLRSADTEHSYRVYVGYLLPVCAPAAHVC